MPESPIQLADDVPHQIGRYRLAYEFAAGGMATVYLAREAGTSGMNRAVALKVIHRHLAEQQDFIDMFLDEAHVASRINHPNVCSVYDFGQSEDGTYYIAMEYLVGETVSRLIRRLSKTKRTSPLLVAQIVADACEGLHAAHELRGPDGEPMGVVHRDVTPSNIYVCYDGTVRIVDFGIAKAANRLHTTRAGQLKGKMSYVSPEQFEHSADRRADVWSLGVVFWEALTKKRLFRRDSEPKTLMAVAKAVVPPPSTHCPELPSGLDEVVLKALQRDPENRFQTAREMGRAIRSALLEHRVLAGPPEIADLMTGLFPEEHAQRLSLVEQTLRVARTGVERVSSVEGEQSNSGVVSDVRLSSTPRVEEFPSFDDYAESEPTHVTDHGVSTVEVDTRASEVDVIAAAEPATAAEPETAALPEPAAKSEPAPKRRSIPRDVRILVLSIAVAALALVGLAKWERSSDAVTSTPLASRLEQRAPIVQPTAPEPEPSPVTETDQDSAETAPDEDSTEAAPDEGSAEVPDVPEQTADARASMRTKRRPTMEPIQQVQPTGGPGTALVVIVGGWAQVSVGERTLGRAPGRFELPAGRHELTIRPFGMDPEEQRTIEINEGRTTRISLTVMR